MSMRGYFTVVLVIYRHFKKFMEIGLKHRFMLVQKHVKSLVHTLRLCMDCLKKLHMSLRMVDAGHLFTDSLKKVHSLLAYSQIRFIFIFFFLVVMSSLCKGISKLSWIFTLVPPKKVKSKHEVIDNLLFPSNF